MRTSTLSRLIAITGLSLASLVFAPGLAFADEPTESDIAQARQLGGQAQEAFDKGHFAESEKFWVAAAKLYPKAPTLALGLARAAAKNGHPLLAQENYNRIIREWGSVAAPPPAFKDALEAARAEIGAVSARIANVVITVEGPKTPTVTLDGEDVKAVALGLKRPTEPGKHKVHAEGPGFKPVDSEFDVAEGGEAKVALKLEPAPASAAAPAQSPAPGAPAASPAAATPARDGSVTTTAGGTSNKTLALVAFGVGGAGLVVGAVTGFLALGKHSALEKDCPGGVCPNDRQGEVDSFKTMGLISTVGFVVGGVGAAAGAILWFTSPKETAQAGAPRWATFEPVKGVTMTPTIGATSAGVAGSF